jgi:hypothetical protein
MTTTKTFKIPGDQIRKIAPGHGACFATDRIVVDGERVGYMYREDPDNDIDSGWRFLAGSESDAYMDDADNHGVYDVNTVANYDPDIIPLLDAPVGSSFERDERGDFIEIDSGKPSAAGGPSATEFPIVEGEYQMTRDWSISLPGRFKKRFDDGSLVLWGQGVTAWIIVWEKPATEEKSDRLAFLRKDISPKAYDVREESAAGLLRFSYRLADDGSEAKAPAYHCFVVGELGHVQMSVYFDEEEDVEVARALGRSLEETAADE